MKPAAVVGTLALVASLAAYAIVSHRLIVADDRSELGYLFALASAGLMAAAAGWGLPRWRWPIALLVTCAGAALWWLRERVGWDPRWLYLVQHAGVHAALGLVFARTLAAGRTPLVTGMATMLHGGPLPEPIPAYTRSVTVAWVLYFFGMALLSTVLFVAGPAQWWSWLANFLTYPAMGLMFAGEYAIRRYRFPDFRHARLLDTVRAFSRPR